VTDWEAGGRTSQAHAERIFCKERPAGPQAVLAVMHMCAGRAERQASLRASAKTYRTQSPPAMSGHRAC